MDLSIKQEDNSRNSSIELLKIIGIILIVLSHVIQTLGSDLYSIIGFNDYFIHLEEATTDITTLTLVILRYTGILGNTLFFICSAWFLIDKKGTNYRKIWRMLLDAFIISICWLVPMIIIKGADVIGPEMILQSIFPTFHINNWYITYYILFCFFCPFLNIILRNIEKKVHFSIAVGLFLCYLFMGFIDSFPAASKLITWISIYFIVSYFKLYCPKFCSNKKANLFMALFGFLGTIVFILLTNSVGLKIEAFSSSLLNWNRDCSYLNFLLAFGLFNLFNQFSFKSKVINYISGLSFLIYIIHENILFRTFIRPQIWQTIFLNLGYNLIMLWLFIYVCLLLIASFIVASFYKISLQKIVHKVGDGLYGVLKKICHRYFGALFDLLK